MTSLVVGIGHPFRGDDAIGPRVAEALAGRLGSDVTVFAHHGEGADLMERWQGCDQVIVIDAMVSGAAPGTIRTWDAIADAPPANLFPKGSHLFGLAEAIEMSRLLGRLPPSMTIIGVEGRCFTLGVPVCAAVERRLDEIVEEIRGLLRMP